jgi:hypothetical protein
MITTIITFPFRYLFARLKKSIGKLDTLKIEPLYTFGNEQQVLFKVRVVESYRQSKPSPHKNYPQNLLAVIRRYAGSSVPDVKVEVSYHQQKKILESDPEGFDNMVSLSFDLFRGTIHKSELVRIWQCSEAEIRNPDGAEFQIDGELIETPEKITIACKPRKISFFVSK